MLTDNRLFRALCVLALSGALVAFTGCGGSDNKSSSGSGGGSVADYKTGAEKAANDFKNSAQAASAKVSSATAPADKVAGLEALKASVTQAADDFAALNPPANLKTDNAELVQEFRDLATTVDDVETALKNNDQQKAAAALPKLTSLQSKIGATIARIQQKVGA
ncbi:MAG: hypothetical protein QOI80_2428 [Solirubrobacteraceae bacterium]|nr:hypothetical protein [Solirubrobacteraceae bacterium]